VVYRKTCGKSAHAPTDSYRRYGNLCDFPQWQVAAAMAGAAAIANTGEQRRTALRLSV
jgi:hypothetical protein